MNKRYGLVFDLSRCIGCLSCWISCKAENIFGKGSGIRVETVGGPHPDTPHGMYPNLSMYYMPVPCMHCDDPPCMEACPMEAIYKRHDGIVLIDEENCNCCEACIEACPYGALTYDGDRDMIRKCTLCYHRIDQGQEPFCVTCCPYEIICFGDLNDPESKASKLISERGAYTHQPEAGTGPAVYYCPEVRRQFENTSCEKVNQHPDTGN